MVRSNKNLLPTRDLSRLLKQLDDTIARLDKGAAGTFMSELLGAEERLMVAKRLSAIILLIEGYSEYSTALLLKLSPTTTEKIHSKMKLGQYDGIIKLLGKSKKNYLAILNTLDNILHLGGVLPHYNGMDRYRKL